MLAKPPADGLHRPAGKTGDEQVAAGRQLGPVVNRHQGQNRSSASAITSEPPPMTGPSRAGTRTRWVSAK